MTVAPPARGHALLPASDCWPEVCARSAGASALFDKLAATGRRESVASLEVCGRSERAALMNGVVTDQATNTTFSGVGWADSGLRWVELRRKRSAATSNLERSVSAPWVFRSVGNDVSTDNFFDSTGSMFIVTGKIQLVDGAGSAVAGLGMDSATMVLQVHVAGEGIMASNANESVRRRYLLLDKHGNFSLALPRAANTQSISIFLRVVDSTLWKKVTVNSVVKDLGTVNLRYGDLNGDNKVEVVQGTFPNETAIGDGLVYQNAFGGLITPLLDDIYLYEWRADFDRNLSIDPDDYNALYSIKAGNTIGDSLE